MEIEYIKDYRDINQGDDTVLVLGYLMDYTVVIKPYLTKQERLQIKKG